MFDFIEELVSCVGPVGAIIALGFDFGCGLWLWSQFVELVDWLFSRLGNRKKP